MVGGVERGDLAVMGPAQNVATSRHFDAGRDPREVLQRGVVVAGRLDALGVGLAVAPLPVVQPVTDPPLARAADAAEHRPSGGPVVQGQALGEGERRLRDNAGQRERLLGHGVHPFPLLGRAVASRFPPEVLAPTGRPGRGLQSVAGAQAPREGQAGEKLSASRGGDAPRPQRGHRARLVGGRWSAGGVAPRTRRGPARMARGLSRRRGGGGTLLRGRRRGSWGWRSRARRASQG